MMAHKELTLKAAQGEWADQPPWVPRIDFLHNSNKGKVTNLGGVASVALLEESILIFCWKRRASGTPGIRHFSS